MRRARRAAELVNGEALSRAQDSPITNVLTNSPLPLIIKNEIALRNAIGSAIEGQKPDWSSFGLLTIHSAAGTREQLPAVDLQGIAMGPLDRFTNQVTLHEMIYVLESLQTQINSTASGAL